MLGPKRLPGWLRDAYFKAVNYNCEDEEKKYEAKELDVHRIIRGSKGGTYRPGNIKVLCKKCHKKYHQGEF